MRSSALLPLLAAMGPRLKVLEVTRTDATLEDILNSCPNLLRLMHFTKDHQTSNLSKLDNKIKLQGLGTTAELDLKGFQKLFASAPDLEVLLLRSYSGGPAGVRPSHFLTMLQNT